MQHITDLVKAAMGFTDAGDRHDQVQVVNEQFPSAEDGEGVTAASGMNIDIMRIVELSVLGLVALLIVFFVLRPMIRSASQGVAAAGGGGALVPFGGGGGGAARAVALPDGQAVAIDQATGQPLALPGPEIEQRIDIARIEGQVKASSVKRVAEFVDKHPEESVSILRTWLHESA
jgi:flagellar M-ring protein FliF